MTPPTVATGTIAAIKAMFTRAAPKLTGAIPTFSVLINPPLQMTICGRRAPRLDRDRRQRQPRHVHAEREQVPCIRLLDARRGCQPLVRSGRVGGPHVGAADGDFLDVGYRKAG